jgi:hypothetical protein
MVDTVLLQSASYVAAAIGVCVAAFYYAINLRLQQRNTRITLETRRAQLFMPLYAYYDQTEFPAKLHNIYVKWKWDDPKDFFEKYGPEVDMDAWSQVQSMGNYFRGVGVLLKDKLVDRRMVYDLLYSPIMMYWEKIEPIAKEYRVKYNQPKSFMYLDYLYNEMTKIESD